MIFRTAFDIGERVRVQYHPGKKCFIIAELQIRTIQSGRLVLVEYRCVTSGGLWGKWYAEGQLEKITP